MSFKKRILPSLFLAALTPSIAVNADTFSGSYDVSYEGYIYTLKIFAGTFGDASSLIQASPWWGDASAAQYFVGTVKMGMGDYTPNLTSTVYGPEFAFGIGNYSSDRIDSYGYHAPEVGELIHLHGGWFTSSSVRNWAYSYSRQIFTALVQPYAAMQNAGLKSIHNNRDLVLAKAGECNNYGWVIGDTDYCIYTNVKNKVSYVNGDTTRGSYGSAVFNGSINVEKTINDKWKAGVAYGMGSANLYDFNFSGITANLNSSNNHYSVYGVKKVNDIFTLKGMVGGSVFDYKAKRNYSSTASTAAYETDGYTAEINGTWDIKKSIKNMQSPIRLQPTVGVAFAAHAQDGFDESGSGVLLTVDPNQAESLLFKTGIGVDKEIIMEGGKWLLVPSLALNYEMDIYADDNHRGLKGGLTGSSDAGTSVVAKTFGQHRGSLKVGADFVMNKDLMFNLNAEYGLAEGGDEQSYGGGFRWQF